MSEEIPDSPGISDDVKLCRLCLIAAIVFAFGKQALLFI